MKERTINEEVVTSVSRANQIIRNYHIIDIEPIKGIDGEDILMIRYAHWEEEES